MTSETVDPTIVPQEEDPLHVPDDSLEKNNDKKLGLLCCYTCEENFSTETELEKHLRSHSTTSKKTLKKSTKSFQIGATDKLMSNNSSKKLHSCSICGAKFEEAKILQYHYKHAHKTHLKKYTQLYPCSICKLNFSSQELESHYRVDHRIEKFPLNNLQSQSTEGDSSSSVSNDNLEQSAPMTPEALKQFSWISSDPILKKFFCRPCRLSYIPSSDKSFKDPTLIAKYRKTSFVLGFKEVTESSVIEHSNSVEHQLALSNVEPYLKQMTSKGVSINKGKTLNTETSLPRKDVPLKRTSNLGNKHSSLSVERLLESPQKNLNSKKMAVVSPRTALLSPIHPRVTNSIKILNSSLMHSSPEQLDEEGEAEYEDHYEDPDYDSIADGSSPHSYNRRVGAKKRKLNPGRQIQIPVNKFALKDYADVPTMQDHPPEVEPDAELENLFRNAHAIVKFSRPLSDFNWMISLDELKGIRYTLQYRSETDCHNFIKTISYTISDVFKSKLREAKFISVLFDSFGDVSETKQELLMYVQFALHGVVYTYFVTKIVADKISAYAIQESFKKKLLEILGNQFKKKVAAIAFDGISLDSNFVADAFSNFRKSLPNEFLEVKCLLHRFEIKIREAIKCPLFDSVMVMLNTAYAIYHTAPSNKGATKFHSSCSLFPIKIRDSSWIVDTLDALRTLWKQYKTILQNLNSLSKTEKSPNENVLAKLLLSNAVIGYAHLLQDVLTSLYGFICEIKKADLTFSKACVEFKKFLVNLEDMRDKPKACLKKFMNRKNFNGRKLKGSFPYPDDTSIRLKEFLQLHFEEFFNSAHITEILDASTWQTTNTGKTKMYGIGQIESLIKRWNSILENNRIDTDQLKVEWIQLKTAIQKDGVGDTNKSTFWQRVNTKYDRSQYANILGLIDLLLTLPTGYNECSQGLRYMESIKKNYGGKFTPEEESEILQVKLHTQDIEKFNPDLAVEMFKSKGTEAEPDEVSDAERANSRLDPVSSDSSEGEGEEYAGNEVSEMDEDEDEECDMMEEENNDSNYYRRLLEMG